MRMRVIMLLANVLACPVALVAAQSTVTPAAAQHLMESGHYKRARAILQPRLATNPNDVEAIYLTSRLKQLEGKDPDTALKLAERAVKLDNKNPRCHLQLARVLSEMVDKASALRQLKLGGKLKTELQTTISLDPRNTEALRYQALIYRHAPAFFGGDKAKAQLIVNQIMQIDPVKGYFLQAEFSLEDKQNDRVEDFYRKAVAANPASYDAYVRLGNHYFGDKRYDQAEIQAREALRIDSDRIEAHNLLAQSLAFQENWAALDAALVQAEKAIPDNLTPHVAAATPSIVIGRELPRAERYLRKYLSQEPELAMPSHARVHWRLGQILEKQGRIGDAISEFQVALKMDASSPAKRDLERLQHSQGGSG